MMSVGWHKTESVVPKAGSTVIGVTYSQHYQEFMDIGLFEYQEVQKQSVWYNKFRISVDRAPTHWCYAPTLPDERRRRGDR